MVSIIYIVYLLPFQPCSTSSTGGTDITIGYGRKRRLAGDRSEDDIKLSVLIAPSPFSNGQGGFIYHPSLTPCISFDNFIVSGS